MPQPPQQTATRTPPTPPRSLASPTPVRRRPQRPARSLSKPRRRSSSPRRECSRGPPTPLSPWPGTTSRFTLPSSLCIASALPCCPTAACRSCMPAYGTRPISMTSASTSRGRSTGPSGSADPGTSKRPGTPRAVAPTTPPLCTRIRTCGRRTSPACTSTRGRCTTTQSTNSALSARTCARRPTLSPPAPAATKTRPKLPLRFRLCKWRAESFTRTSSARLSRPPSTPRTPRTSTPMRLAWPLLRAPCVRPLCTMRPRTLLRAALPWQRYGKVWRRCRWLMPPLPAISASCSPEQQSRRRRKQRRRLLLRHR
mmetsp:Transcript_44310/g.65181  ORF Transcript_44310/g.65181 Transcript_44310/m.65181 type:complete len:312 (+) Transcript_44310:569-1504(+)